jgi:hypothetical protein
MMMMMMMMMMMYGDNQAQINCIAQHCVAYRVVSMTGAMSSSGSVGERCWWMTETWAEPCDVTAVADGSVVTSVKRTLPAERTLGPTCPH